MSPEAIRILSVEDRGRYGHGKSILSKLGVNGRTHAVTVGLMRGIIAL